MQRIRNLKVGMKIGLGFGLITLVLMGVVLITIQHVKNMEGLSKRLAHLRNPTAHASLMMLNGMNHSLASLRGWIILGENKFKEERAQAWTEQIEPSLETLKDLSEEWTDPKNRERLSFIEVKLADFKRFQNEIERIAQTEENTPAKKILFSEAEPLEEIIMRNISKMIQLELKMSASPDRRELLGLMADVEGQTNLSMEKTDEYLLSGEERFKKAFEDSWSLNEKRFAKMKRLSNLLVSDQKVALNKIDRSMKKLGPILKKIVRIRSHEGWNLANTWLSDKAAPAAFQIKEKLNEMADSQNQLLQADMEAISQQTHRLIIFLVLLFFAGALLSGVLGAAITNSVSEPIKNVSRMARELAEGNLRQKKLPVVSNDELCELSQSLNQLLDRLKKVQPFGKPSSK